MKLTKKQKNIMDVVVARNPDDTDVDLDQILERLPYETTKASLQFSIRALILAGHLKKTGTEKRRNARRTVIAATDIGKAITGGLSALPVSLAEPDLASITEHLEDLT